MRFMRFFAAIRPLFLLAGTCLLLGNAFLVAQSTILALPPEVSSAIEANSRTLSGVPGPAYFQNHTDYQIRATLNPKSDSIRGTAQLNYSNDSPDDLEILVLRLYQDMYRKGFDADEEIHPKDQTSGTGLYRIVMDGITLDIDSQTTRQGTNLIIHLDEPLLAGDSTVLEIDWAFKIPTETLNRMGRYAPGSYFIAYWYPQMAVYDDLHGWDMLDYKGTVEFYNDFGNFDISITAPQDYVLWATGVLQNADQLLAEPYLSRFQQAATSDEVVRIVNKDEVDSGVQVTQPSEDGWHTWHFQASHVPDVAFAAANNYLWDATSVVVDDATGRRVMAQACYRSSSKDFYDVAGFSRDIIRDLSTEIPGIPFPYPQITVYNGDKGGGGMEYPMMVNDASVFSKAFAFSLTYHEIAHTYFPFYMGINERRYAWMDEGWATFLPEDLVVEKGYQKEPLRLSMMGYTMLAGTEREKAMMTPSYELEGMAYGIASYPKPGLAYYVLRDMLGEEAFRTVLKGYMERWNGKHPAPFDFFFSFNDLSGKNLDWYWQAWFFETLKPDLSLVPIQIKGKNAHFRIENRGGLPLPIYLTIELKDGTIESRHMGADVWANGTTSWEFDEKMDDKIKEIKLGVGWIPDVNSKDNTWKAISVKKGGK